MKGDNGRAVVLHVIDSLVAHGAEQDLASTVPLIDPARFHHIVCCLNEGGPFEQPLRDAGIEIVILGRRSRWDLGTLYRLWRLMRRERVDIANPHLYSSSFWARVAAILAGVSVRIVTQENALDLEKGVRGWHHDLADKILDPRTTMFVGVSEHIQRVLVEQKGIPPERVTVIESRVDLSRFDIAVDVRRQRLDLGLRPDAAVIGMIARLHYQKGHEYLLQAFRRVLGAVADAQLLIVGDGEREVELKAMAKDMGMAAQVVFAGARRDIPALLSVMDVFTMSSVMEGTPTALLEAMAMKRPVVVTAVGGMPVLVTDRETGLLVPARDAVALGDALTWMLEHRAEAEKIGERAGEFVRARYDVRTSARQYEELYTRLLAARK